MRYAAQNFMLIVICEYINIFTDTFLYSRESVKRSEISNIQV